VGEDVKAARLAELQDLLMTQQHAFDDAQLGRTLPVLFEKPGRAAGQLMGRTPYLQPVHAQLPEAMIGQVVKVHVTKRTANSLHGTPI
jgi:tRNA-2-methylthio-N6-dimethylallyladenosine synthase